MQFVEELNMPRFASCSNYFEYELLLNTPTRGVVTIEIYVFNTGAVYAQGHRLCMSPHPCESHAAPMLPLRRSTRMLQLFHTWAHAHLDAGAEVGGGRHQV